MKKLFLILAALSSFKAFSYPQNIAQGYTSCSTCHVAPDGGGKANDYGHLAMEALIPDKADLFGWMSNYRENRAENVVAGYNEEGEAKFQWSLGGSLRGMVLDKFQFEPEAKTTLRGFPMLMELQALSLYGNFGFYGAINLLLEPSMDNPNKRKPKAFSRAHWFLYRLNYRYYVRAGRMELPFGLKTVDHTRDTRSVIGFGTKDQYYGIQFDYVTENFSLHLMPFWGNHLKEKFDLQSKEEKGGALTLNIMAPRSFLFGISSLVRSDPDENLDLAYSLFAQGKLPKQSYVLGEVVHRIRFKNETQHQMASFVRVGKIFSEWFDLYLEYGEQHKEDFKPITNRIRLGAKSRLFPWLELEPLIEYKFGGSKEIQENKSLMFALQLHAFY